MIASNYSISLIHNLTENPDKRASELHRLPVLAIEECEGKWFFKDCLGNRVPTTREQIKGFVFGCDRIKVFGSVYHYTVYYPQHKPHSRELEILRKKLG